MFGLVLDLGQKSDTDPTLNLEQPEPGTFVSKPQQNLTTIMCREARPQQLRYILFNLVYSNKLSSKIFVKSSSTQNLSHSIKNSAQPDPTTAGQVSSCCVWHQCHALMCTGARE